MIAVIPCAGHGTRMGRITQVVPKELLPFGNKLVIDFILEELLATGHQKIFVIIREGKEAIRNYILKHYPSRYFQFVYQLQPKGLGHAYLQVKGLIDEPFLGILPDHLAFGGITEKIWQRYRIISQKENQPFIFKSCVRISLKEAQFSTGRRPGEEITPFRSTGRTIYPPEFLDFISENDYDPYFNEINERVPEEKFAKSYKIYSHRIKGKVWDIGTLEGYLFYLKRYLSFCVSKTQ
ncbi:MAG: hypothetical protein LWW94_07515 [Candidatus Desulfofervidaceae bacterium]|nr:hypothetical protein [Candidatus Desulfofervidaceae bacterium]